ncbi:MAG TPA: hypothetical protein DHW02_08035 [Ktedonobacter sp.]|nr:hypothetical protein [Ktedonobacter sp.]
MNTSDTSITANTTLSAEIVRPLTALTRISPTVLDEIRVSQVTDVQQNLPLDSTRVGNLYKDRFDPNLFWYLPTFTLADDPDAAFRFAATQTGTDANGNAFNRATLVLSLKKAVPPDVQLSQAQNPSATFREIPFTQFTVTLSTTFKDANGVDQQNTYAGTMNSQTDGSLQVSFDTMLGPAVIIAYQNITRDGNAQIALSASYAVWLVRYYPRPVDVPPIWTLRQAYTPQMLATLAPQIAQAPQTSTEITSVQPQLREAVHRQPQLSEAASIHPQLEEGISPVIASSIESSPSMHIADNPVLMRPPIERWPPIGGGGFVASYTQSVEQMNVALPLALKYASGAYKQDFTVANGANVRPIISVDDLKDYNVRQSEYTEFLAFGDISSKYPSFSRLYIGVLSQTVLAIPAHYGIIRSSTGCAAVCQALVDSSPVTTSGSRFQFSFLLGPIISAIDLLQLSQDINAYSGLKDYKLQLPSQLDSSVVATLLTPFKSSCTYATGTLPHTFSVVVEIQDDPTALPAVANANLFIKQLAATVEPYLAGQFGIKLDDYYTPAVEANSVLNFSMTGGTDELSFTNDEATQTIVLTNRSPLDLLLTRYAFYTPNDLPITPSPLQQTIVNQKTASLPLPTNHTDPNFLVLVDDTLALESPFTKQSLGRYLAFQAQDVQSVQYDLGINASNIDFNARSINQIVAQIRFSDPSTSTIAVPALTLSADLLVNSVHIVVPIEYAISSLIATIEFTVKLIDTQQNPLSFTLTNDFIDHAIFVLQNSDLPIGVPG